jgi:hypothetical protein
MPDAKELIDQQLLEMRWRTLSLAADLDRIARADTGQGTLAQDPRLAKLRKALELLSKPDAPPNRAEQVQLIFSDMTPPPAK